MMRVARKIDRSALSKKLIHSLYHYSSPLLEQQLWGKTFRNPVGLAAGFDKNGYLPPIMKPLGMGFTEVGSITARPHPGNPKPRLFRLPNDRALINRIGLNNDGAQAVINRLHRHAPPCRQESILQKLRIRVFRAMMPFVIISSLIKKLAKLLITSLSIYRVQTLLTDVRLRSLHCWTSFCLLYLQAPVLKLCPLSSNFRQI